MWIYKICQGTNKQYTVVDRCYDKESAEILKRNFEFWNKKKTFIKRYSEKEG